MKIKVRFPNELTFVEVDHFKGKKFKTKHVFENEVFGKYFGLLISIPRYEYEEKIKK